MLTFEGSLTSVYASHDLQSFTSAIRAETILWLKCPTLIFTLQTFLDWIWFKSANASATLPTSDVISFEHPFWFALHCQLCLIFQLLSEKSLPGRVGIAKWEVVGRDLHENSRSVKGLLNCTINDEDLMPWPRRYALVWVLTVFCIWS